MDGRLILQNGKLLINERGRLSVADDCCCGLRTVYELIDITCTRADPIYSYEEPVRFGDLPEFGQERTALYCHPAYPDSCWAYRGGTRQCGGPVWNDYQKKYVYYRCPPTYHLDEFSTCSAEQCYNDHGIQLSYRNVVAPTAYVTISGVTRHDHCYKWYCSDPGYDVGHKVKSISGIDGTYLLPESGIYTYGGTQLTYRGYGYPGTWTTEHFNSYDCGGTSLGTCTYPDFKVRVYFSPCVLSNGRHIDRINSLYIEKDSQPMCTAGTCSFHRDVFYYSAGIDDSVYTWGDPVPNMANGATTRYASETGTVVIEPNWVS